MTRMLLSLLLGLTLAACQTGPSGKASLRQQKLLTQIGFVETQRGWEFSLAERLLFDFDDSRLKAGQKESIERIGAQLGKVGIMTAQVEGHTDAVGTDEYNAGLSKARAEAVAQPLRDSGLALTADQVVGRGAAFPVGDNATAEGRADNRRVVIIVTP